MKKNFTEIEIPFGVKDSELYQFTYTIPDGYSAEIKDGKVIMQKKESEDERIMEAISYAIGTATHQDGTLINNVTQDEALAYLEKQKDEAQKQFNLGIQAGKEEAMYEMKPLSAEETELNSIAFLEQLGYTCVPPGAEQKPSTPEDIAAAYQMGLADGRREQKPDIEAKLKEEYKRGWDNALLQLPEEVDSQIWQIVNNSAKTWEQGFAILMAAKKAFEKGKAEGLKEQKPAEWSEEDEEHINSILKRLEGMCKKGATFTPTRFAVSEDEDWLKSLRPKLRKNWSMEDAVAMKDIQMIISVSGRSERNKRDLRAWVAEHCNAFSLPHWKPSKEQMRCLLDCVSKAKEIHNASVGGYDAYRILVSLYDELNKLL